MIKITLLLCLIAVCLSGHYEEHSYGKMNTIELRSNDYHHIDEKRTILDGTSDLQSTDKDITDIVEKLIRQIQNLLNKCPEDEGGIIVHLRDVVAGLLEAVLNLVASLLALVGALLGDIISSLITLNTDLKTHCTTLNDVLSQLTTGVTHILCGLVGTVDDIAGEINNLLTSLNPLVSQLEQVLEDITDQTLKTTVQDLLNELHTLTTNLGKLVSQLLSAVLKLVGEILAALTNDVVPLVNQLIQDLTGKTEITAEQIQQCNTLNGFLENLIKTVQDLVNQLVNPLPLGINLRGLLDALIVLVDTTLLQLIEILRAIVDSTGDLAPILAKLVEHQQSLSQLVGQIPS